MSHQDCRCKVVSHSEVGNVAVCQGCGQVQLNLQYMTLRFEAGAFHVLANMIAQAQGRMSGAGTTNPAAVQLAPATGLH